MALEVWLILVVWLLVWLLVLLVLVVGLLLEVLLVMTSDILHLLLVHIMVAAVHCDDARDVM